ncbi:unnamed protein product [Linum tenue]|uniref:Signal peptidase complex subunit 1 n=1 Tax=Linum tenue TaxID=586396 RepID=A0AAV0HAD2_9ROSI|nr:unnamed protein product [Linum tenue]
MGLRPTKNSNLTGHDPIFSVQISRIFPNYLFICFYFPWAKGRRLEESKTIPGLGPLLVFPISSLSLIAAAVAHISSTAAADLFSSFTTMDWQGQKVAEQLMQLMLLASAVMAFLTGYIMGSFQTMMLIYAGGIVLTALIVVPNWPGFNRHPLRWLDPLEADKHPKPPPQPVASKKNKSKK